MKLRMFRELAKNRHVILKISPILRFSAAINAEFSSLAFLKLIDQVQFKSSATILINSLRKQLKYKHTASKLSVCASTTITASSSQSALTVY